MRAPRPLTSTSTPTRRSKKKRSPEPRRSASNPADTDPPTASSPFSTACDYVERPSAGHHIDQQDPAARPAPVNITSYGTYNRLCGIPHNRFGGGPSEKDQVNWHLVGGLPYVTSGPESGGG